MPLAMFSDETGWEHARKSARFTAAAAAADDEHEKLAKPLRSHLIKWNAIDQERRDADDAMVDANARVSRLDAALDREVANLASRLLYECQQDNLHPTYKRYFPEPPSEVIRLGLESEIERTRAFAVVAAEHAPSKEVHAVLKAIEALQKRGKTALGQREQVAEQQNRISLRMRAWKDTANEVRRSVETALEAHAIEKGMPRTYADDFFPAHRAAKSRKVKGVTGGETGPATE